MTRYVLISEIVGSSPLARGLPPCRLRGTRPARIIPARAGFTRPDGIAGAGPPDHPRSRGVYMASRTVPSSPIGSSPLARGLRMDRIREIQDLGIIPARAGFTNRGQNCRQKPEDHPRSRGVYSSSAISFSYLRGSSPLARGLLGDDIGEDRAVGIIPARAGFTPSPSRGVDFSRDHPRSRGVYGVSSRSPSPTLGSSPLARGLLSIWRPRRPRARIIPARAGFTAPLS